MALRQQQREEAAARQRARDRRNLFIIAGVIGAAAVAILLVAHDLNQASKQSNASRLAFQAGSGTICTQAEDEGTPFHIGQYTQCFDKGYPPTSSTHNTG